jgi:hypothetical protein
MKRNPISILMSLCALIFCINNIYAQEFDNERAEMWIRGGTNDDLWNGNSGKVGINTSTPYRQLHVNGDFESHVVYTNAAHISGDMDISGILTLNRDAIVEGDLSVDGILQASNFGETITLNNSLSTSPYTLKLKTLGNNDWGIEHSSQLTETEFYGMGLRIKDNSSNGFYIRDGVSNQMRMVIRNGNVGIGTSNPSHKLSVNGTIRSKEVIVQTGWSDFVFYDDYNLMPLSEVEKFVKENKHLPEIPSEREVEENGVELGTISSKLLQKIEELTLYMIDQDKRIEKLEKENKELNDLLKGN